MLKASPEQRPDARARLLAAAERMFAEQGLASTSVRDLAREADVNIAAVNYYFGNKENLYIETLRHSFSSAREVLPKFESILEQAKEKATSEAALDGIRLYIEEFLSNLFAATQQSKHVVLMARELSSPTPALDVIVEEFILPKQRVLLLLIQQARPDIKDPRDLQFYASSIIAQCLHHCMTLPVVLRLHKRKKVTPDFVHQISTHIANFSIAALRGGTQ